MVFSSGDVDNALLIMKEAAQWLADAGRPLWQPEDFSKDNILKENNEDDFRVGYESGEPVAAMILKWSDPDFWPDAKPNESGFIHKLAVRRAYAGKGYAAGMIKCAEDECRGRGISRLRLDCAADRLKLRRLYEDLGFVRVNGRWRGEFYVAFYEKRIR
ncbi:MAG: GNAT family N-acetyltransferase [Spirochaetales bacterium]|nr:GNAT family N-acetyltransferase [Spirochaetales bacterium]